MSHENRDRQVLPTVNDADMWSPARCAVVFVLCLGAFAVVIGVGCQLIVLQPTAPARVVAGEAGHELQPTHGTHFPFGTPEAVIVGEQEPQPLASFLAADSNNPADSASVRAVFSERPLWQVLVEDVLR